MQSIHHFILSVVIFFTGIFGFGDHSVTTKSLLSEKTALPVNISNDPNVQLPITASTNEISGTSSQVSVENTFIKRVEGKINRSLPCDVIADFDVFKTEGVGSYDLHRPCHKEDWNKEDDVDYSTQGWAIVSVGGKNYSFFYKPEYVKCACANSWVGYFDTGALYIKDNRMFIASSSLKFFADIPKGFISVGKIFFVKDKPYAVFVDSKSAYVFYPDTTEIKKLYTVPQNKMLCSQEIDCFPSVDLSDDEKYLLIDYHDDNYRNDPRGNGSTTILLPTE